MPYAAPLLPPQTSGVNQYLLFIKVRADAPELTMVYQKKNDISLQSLFSGYQSETGAASIIIHARMLTLFLWGLLPVVAQMPLAATLHGCALRYQSTQWRCQVSATI